MTSRKNDATTWHLNLYFAIFALVVYAVHTT